MYRPVEDIEEINRLDQERVRLLVEENRELKGKLTTALVQAGLSIDDVERIQYEKEQQELRHAALQNLQLAPFCDLKKEESSIPFDDVGERIVVRDGKKIKQVKHLRGLDSSGEEICLYQEWVMTKWEIEEMEKEEQEKRNAEAEKQFLEKQNRISEEEPSIPYNKKIQSVVLGWFW